MITADLAVLQGYLVEEEEEGVMGGFRLIPTQISIELLSHSK